MKFLIVLIFLLIVAALVAFRYRKQIQTALYFYRMYRNMRQMAKPQDNPKIDRPAANSALVRCSGCGDWVEETNVLKMGNKISYCSAACIEKSVNRV